MSTKGGKGSKALLNGPLQHKKEDKVTPEAIYGKIRELASISALLRRTGCLKRFPTEPTETDDALAINFLEY